MLKQLNHFTCNNNHQHTANMFGTQDKGAEKLQSSDRQITPRVKLKTTLDQKHPFWRTPVAHRRTDSDWDPNSRETVVNNNGVLLSTIGLLH